MQQGPRLPPNIPTTLHRNEAVAVTFQLQWAFALLTAAKALLFIAPHVSGLV